MQFESLVRSEVAATAVLGAVLRQESARRAFLSQVAQGAERLPPALRDAFLDLCGRLNRAGDVEVLVEPHLANAGNLDLALVSRHEHAVLAVETKTVSLLSSHQLTKYQLALRDADPTGTPSPDGIVGGRRVSGTVLLCPGNRLDSQRAKDERGFDRSVVLRFADLAPLRGAVADAAASLPNLTRIAADHLLDWITDERAAAGTLHDRRTDLLDAVAEGLGDGWTVHARSTARLDFTPPGGNARWSLHAGTSPTQHLRLELPAPLPLSTGRTTLVDLAGGYSSFSIPEPFPRRGRAWLEPDADLTGQVQTAVNLIEMVRGRLAAGLA